jgi:hypothetical protein
MLVTTYDLEGKAGPTLELRCTDAATLVIDGVPVLAVSHWGVYMALTLRDRLVLVRATDYERVVGYACSLLHYPRS